MTEEQMQERYSRQQDIVPAGRLAECRATIVGVGAIGRQVALQLTAIGIPCLQLVDHDVVEISNLASQGYLQDDLGKAKVKATAALCRQINPDLDIHEVNDRFRRSMEIGNALFCAVDSIETRRLIWTATKDHVNVFIDGRMSAEVLRVLIACDQASRQHYPTTLFAAGQAYAGPCTAKTTLYCANIAAGLMISQFTKHLRQLPIDDDIQFNLLTCEINIGDY